MSITWLNYIVNAIIDLSIVCKRKKKKKTQYTDIAGKTSLFMDCVNNTREQYIAIALVLELIPFYVDTIILLFKFYMCTHEFVCVFPCEQFNYH